MTDDQCSVMHAPTEHTGTLDPACPLCGQPRCHRQASSTGMRCRNHPALGSRMKCRFHGGRKKQAEIERARVGCEYFGVPVVGIDPVTALSDELARTAGAVAWLGEKVNEIQDAEDLIFGLVKETDYTETGAAYREYQATVNGWVQLWQGERDRLVRIAKICINAGIDERKVRSMERLAGSMLTVLEAVFAELNLTPEQRAIVRVAVPQQLRRLAVHTIETSGPRRSR